eukprot:SAG22_NODE_1430_length_4441_cov_2.360894_2_plen_101_part_00
MRVCLCVNVCVTVPQLALFEAEQDRKASGSPGSEQGTAPPPPATAGRPGGSSGAAEAVSLVSHGDTANLAATLTDPNVAVPIPPAGQKQKQVKRKKKAEE